MDLEELRCYSQVNGNYIENRSVEPSYYSANHEIPDYEEPDLSLLTPCEFCNRTFIPASLNKHKRGCYKSWLKAKERESKMSNDHESSYHTTGYHGEKPILTIEQMLAKRRQRRLNWRLRHEEFMRAVHAARDYAEAVATGNPLPPPPPPMIEPDLKQCPHCQRKFHEKSIDRHIIRCKEQSIRNNKERPSYQTMEAKRRLAVRLYYQPNSRPNSCLSMTNSEPPASFSRPSSRQTDFDYGRNVESSNSFNIGRHSSMSVIDRNEVRPKLPSSILDNINKPHDRLTPRHSFKDYKNTQGHIPSYDLRMSTPNIAEHFSTGRRSNMSMGLSRNSSRQSMVGNSEMENSTKHRNDLHSIKSDTYSARRNIRRSTSCISQTRPTSNCRTEKLLIDNTTKNDIRIYNHKPFSCNRSSTRDTKLSKEISKSNIQLNKVVDTEMSYGRHRSKDRRCKKSARNFDTSILSSKSTVSLDKVEHVSLDPDCKVISRTISRHGDNKDVTNVNEVSIKKHRGKSKVTTMDRHDLLKAEERESVIVALENEETTVVEKVINKHDKPINHSSIKLSNSEINLNAPKSEIVKSISTENLKLITKIPSSVPVPGNRVRNEIQIRIKSHAQSDASNKSKMNENEISKVTTVPTFQELSTRKKTKENDEKKSYSLFRQIDPKGEAPSPPQSSLRFVSNCSLSKGKEQAQGDNNFAISKLQPNINFEENKNANNIQPLNLYQCKSIKSVSISDQNNTTKFRSSISLQDSLNRSEETPTKVVKSSEPGSFCYECGHKFPEQEAKFCCSCGCKRSEIVLQK